MKLYTIMHVGTYEKLLTEKVLVNDGSVYNDDDFMLKEFVPLYDWMVEQMETRGIRRPDGAAYPFWGWYRYSSLMVKPDLRQGGHAPRGTSCVCVELELPEGSVLLSNFDSWGCILSGYPVLPEENWDELYDEFKKLPIEKQHEVKLQTWQKIFTEFEDSPIQGVYWKLEMANVRNARFFKAK